MKIVGCCFADHRYRAMPWSAAEQVRPEAANDRVVDPNLGHLPLGLRPDTDYATATLDLGVGNMLLFYSDGVVEAQDDRDVLYGDDRLQELLLQAGRRSTDAKSLITLLYRDVNCFQVSVGQLDDITAIAVCFGYPSEVPYSRLDDPGHKPKWSDSKIDLILELQHSP